MMNTSNMSEEDKARMYQAAKKCNFLCLFLVTTAAFTMSLYATGFCAFVDRKVTLNEGSTISGICATQNIPDEQCVSILNDHGVGFWAWQMTVPVDVQACFSYTQYIDGIGYVTPEFDRKFNSAKACQGVAVFFGALAWFTMAFSSCCPFNQSATKCLSGYFLIAFLFQSLAFLIFQSDICDPGFFSVYFGGTIPDDIATVSCSRNMATNMAIAAVVLYFYAMSLVPMAAAPDPVMNFGASGDNDDEKEEGGANAAVSETSGRDKDDFADIDEDDA